MAPSPRVVNAFRAMRGIGIPDAEGKPLLKKLLRLYEKKWELIEEDNYRTLIEAYFEMKDDENNAANFNKSVHSDEQSGCGNGKSVHLGEQSGCGNAKSVHSGEQGGCGIEKSGHLGEQSGCGNGKSVHLGEQSGCGSASNGKQPVVELIPKTEPCDDGVQQPHVVKKKKVMIIPKTEPIEESSSGFVNVESIKRAKIEPRDESGLALVNVESIKRGKTEPCDEDELCSALVNVESTKIDEKVLVVSENGQCIPLAMVKSGSGLVKVESSKREKEKDLMISETGQCISGSLAMVDDWISALVDNAESIKREEEVLSTEEEKEIDDFDVVPLAMLPPAVPSPSNDLPSNHSVKALPPKYVILNNGVNNSAGTNQGSVTPEISVTVDCGATRTTGLKRRASKIYNPETYLNRKGSGCFKTIIDDITKGQEMVKISLVDGIGSEALPDFNYIRQNIIYQNANVNISLARIADEDCCSECLGDCLTSPITCACARETGGEFAYSPQGLLKEEFLNSCMSMKREPQLHHFVYCPDCPLERTKNEHMPERCKGHLVRKFIKECWRKCGCRILCGNRVVQRGITCKLQVFFTPEGKGWGLRTLEDIPKGTFVCEYAGEVLTNQELYERITQSSGNDRHTYPVTLDADWGSEVGLRDEEALCLDATGFGNVARFINHRCFDGNLIDIPVELETPDRHYYHLAFFTTRKVNAFQELTWDYGIHFDDQNHPIKAFQCCCGSVFCRDKNRKRSVILSYLVKPMRIYIYNNKKQALLPKCLGIYIYIYYLDRGKKHNVIIYILLQQCAYA
ncbi:histone-lysine N-methyltransferase SUVR4 isoform X2 [Fagus crenata]